MATNHTLEPTEMLALLFMAVQAALAAEETEREIAKAKAAEDKERERKAYLERFDVQTQQRVDDAKRDAKGRLQGPLGDKVVEELDRLAELAPYVKHGKNDQRLIGQRLHNIEEHISLTGLVARGLVPETNPQYLESKKWVNNNLLPAPPSMDELAGTTTHRGGHVKQDRGVGMEM